MLFMVRGGGVGLKEEGTNVFYCCLIKTFICKKGECEMLSKFKYSFVAIVAIGLVFCLSNLGSAYEEKPASIQVVVSGLGYALEDAEVTCGEDSASTGKNGIATFQVRKGVYALSATGPHGGEASREVRVSPGEIVQVTFELGAAALHASGGH